MKLSTLFYIRINISINHKRYLVPEGVFSNKDKYASHSIMWDVITYRSTRYLLLVPKASYMHSKVTSHDASWRLHSPTTRLFIEHIVQNNIKGNAKNLHYWPFFRGIHRWPTLPFTQGQWCWKYFITMTSSRGQCHLQIPEYAPALCDTIKRSQYTCIGNYIIILF